MYLCAIIDLHKPSLPDGLRSVSASYVCVRGIVSSSWTVGGRDFHFEIEIPANARAKVYVPAASATSIKEGGVLAAEAKGIRFLRMESGYAVFAIGSGSYSFDSIR